MSAIEVIAQIQLAVRRADTSDEVMANKLAAESLEQYVSELVDDKILAAMDRLGMADI